MDLEVPSEEEIRSLAMGDLIILRNQLLSATGTRSMAPMTRYESILDSTIALATLYAGRAAQPPAPDWVREIDQSTGMVELPEPEPVDWEALALKEIEAANASAVEEARIAKEATRAKAKAEADRAIESAWTAKAKAKEATLAEAARAKAEIAAAEYDDLDGPVVTGRIKELIDLDYEDTEIWQILSKEFKFGAEIYQG